MQSASRFAIFNNTSSDLRFTDVFGQEWLLKEGRSADVYLADDAGRAMARRGYRVSIIQADTVPVSGSVGGYTAVKRVTLETLAADGDYSAGKSIGGVVAVDIARIAGGSGLLTALGIRSLNEITEDLYLHVFTAEPTESTITDGETISIDSEDNRKLYKTYKVEASSWVKLGSSPWYTVELLDVSGSGDTLSYALETGTELFFVIEPAGSVTVTANSLDLIVCAENN